MLLPDGVLSGEILGGDAPGSVLTVSNLIVII